MKLKKEIILIILIVVGISILEFLTSYISKNSVEEVSNRLDEIVKIIEISIDLEKDGKLTDESENNMKNIICDFKNEWYKKQEKLSLFVEHDELEKVTEKVIVLEENVKNEEYETALEHSAEFRFWLQHFEEKEKLKIKNIF